VSRTHFPVHNDDEKDVHGEKCMLRWGGSSRKSERFKTVRGEGMVGWWEKRSMVERGGGTPARAPSHVSTRVQGNNTLRFTFKGTIHYVSRSREQYSRAE
jgi:hypothetical protein